MVKTLFLTVLLSPLGTACSSKQESSRPSGAYDLDFHNPKTSSSEATYQPGSDEEAELLSQAMQNYDKELFSLARESFTKLAQEFPGGYYAAFAELKAADSDYYLERYPEALVAYEEFLKVHPGHQAAPYAMLQIANCYREQYKGERQDQTPLLTAIKHYRQLLERFPRSAQAEIAERHIRNSRELLAEHERLVASFYFRQGLLEASANRLNQLRKHYPETRAAADAQELIAQFSAEKPEFTALLAKSEADGAISAEKETLASPQQNPATDGLPPSSVSGKLAGYQMAIVGSEQQEEVVVPEEKEPQAQAEKEQQPLALSCDEREGLFVFTGEFAAPAKIAKSEDKATAPDLTTTVVEIQVAEKSSRNESVSPPLQCQVGGSAAVLTPSTNGARLVLTYPADHSRRLLVLDRPYRLIGIIKPSAIQQ